MSEFLPIIKYVSQYIKLTDKELEYFISLLTIVSVKKKQYIVQPGFACNCRSFVVKGSMRGFLIDDKGNDHTVSLAIENYWISDINSYFTQQPATLFVEALEDSILIQLDFNSEENLLQTYPRFERLFRILAKRAYTSLQARTLSNHINTAEERYDLFLRDYPLFPQRIPQYAIASYLGISPEFLSKIRNRKTRN